ncbi:hypothetical protein [Anatilimnocola floriformis]|uniref:hypothetical protein n=1 Tax=Anatilimnocola floriformis TaxID=2948575 RepID=UPI0020C4B3CB|nr:hypothetical protein [Anatilimnocola floriformis]
MIILFLLFAQIETEKVAIPDGKTHIIHVRDWHYVSKENYAADTGLEGDELDKDYAEFLGQVKAVQESQKAILRNHKTVYIERLSKGDMPIFEAMIRVQRKAPDEQTALNIGAAGQLLVEKKIKVRPAEADDFRKANPVKDGKVEIDEKLMEEREDAIVKNLLKKKGTVVLILGGGHDLSDNIRRLKVDCGYTTITPKDYPVNP